MTRRFGLWIIGSALGLIPLAGCALWKPTGSADPPPAKTIERRTTLPNEPVPVDIKPPVTPPTPKVDNELSKNEQTGIKPPVPIPDIPTIKPPASQNTEVQTANPPVPHEPLVDALICVFEDRPNEALQFLNKYDPPTQQFFLGSLPYLSTLAKKGIDQLSPPEIEVLNKQLQSLSMTLIPRTKLVIDKACFCAEITDFGIYDKLPETHVFRPGELVQIYVELRNFVSEPSKNSLRDPVSCYFEIRDQNGKMVLADKFDDGKKAILRQSFQQDYFNNYCLYLPLDLRPGNYHLTLMVKDETRPNQPREARKTLEFRVAPAGRVP